LPRKANLELYAPREPLPVAELFGDPPSFLDSIAREREQLQEERKEKLRGEQMREQQSAHR